MTVGKKGTLDDLSLMILGKISLSWIQECLNPANKDEKVGDLLEKFQKNNNNASIGNQSIILMAAYLFFVYPKEKDFKIGDYSFVDASKFNVSSWGKKRGKYHLCRRIRNALAHSSVHIDENGQMTFEDTNPYDETDVFKCTISVGDFGTFIEKFMNKSKDRFFENRV
ncbi:hypothetical protein [Bacillus cereus group sp. TH152-1LC]|uniref:hypothetical protein n=1 Tax=Bacillus cereus group sp. TH152-1LC TaxID=3018060 RepID=UPI0022DF996F|nr:hypothetical protein [Bacillus cereus group sp. TH152-1LC]MDA1675403.1 hypothetical protein [Bacillus cereus group sp. TH152-1LC]